MRAARAHLGSVGRKPTDFKPFAHAHLREELAKQENALSAEARDLDRVVAEVMRMLGELRIGSFVFSADFKNVAHCTLRRGIVAGRFGLAVAEDIQWERRNQFLAHPMAGFDRVFSPDRGTRRENLDEGKTQAVPLILQSTAYSASRLQDVFVVAQGH